MKIPGRLTRFIAWLVTPGLPRNPKAGDIWRDPFTRRTYVYDPTRDRSRR